MRGKDFSFFVKLVENFLKMSTLAAMLIVGKSVSLQIRFSIFSCLYVIARTECNLSRMVFLCRSILILEAPRMIISLLPNMYDLMKPEIYLPASLTYFFNCKKSTLCYSIFFSSPSTSLSKQKFLELIEN